MPKKRPPEQKAAAVEMFEQGIGYELVAKRLGIHRSVATSWFYTYRALGKEALLTGSHRTYSQEQKLAAVLDVVEGGLSTVEVMERHGIKSSTQVHAWRKAYEKGGAAALAPKPKGRPKGSAAEPESELERLRAENERLRCELEVQKRLNALAERKRQGAKRRK